jgi:hypothetical protein
MLLQQQPSTKVASGGAAPVICWMHELLAQMRCKAVILCRAPIFF